MSVWTRQVHLHPFLSYYSALWFFGNIPIHEKHVLVSICEDSKSVALGIVFYCIYYFSTSSLNISRYFNIVTFLPLNTSFLVNNASMTLSQWVIEIIAWHQLHFLDKVQLTRTMEIFSCKIQIWSLWFDSIWISYNCIDSNCYSQKDCNQKLNDFFQWWTRNQSF